MGRLCLFKRLCCSDRAVKVLVLLGVLALVGTPVLPAGDPCAKGNLELKDDYAATITGKAAIDVLANDQRPRGLALTVQVLSTTCSGDVSVGFDTVVYQPSAPLETSCKIRYRAHDSRPGGSVNLLATSADITVSPNGVLFKDGFETGNTINWSSCLGC